MTTLSKILINNSFSENKNIITNKVIPITFNEIWNNHLQGFQISFKPQTFEVKKIFIKVDTTYRKGQYNNEIKTLRKIKRQDALSLIQKDAKVLSYKNIMYIFNSNIPRKIVETFRTDLISSTKHLAFKELTSTHSQYKDLKDVKFPQYTKNDEILNFEPQGLLNLTYNAFNAIRYISQIDFKNLTKRSEKVLINIEQTTEAAASVAAPINIITKKCYEAADGLTILFDKVISFVKMITLDFKLTDFILFLGSIYEVLKELLNFEKSEVTFKPQSFEHVIFSAILSGCAGAYIRNVFKHLSLFSRFKIFDDSTVVQDILSYILELPLLICNYLIANFPSTPLLKQFQTAYLKMLDMIPFSRAKLFASKFQELYDQYARKNSIISNLEFQDKWKKFYADFSAWTQAYQLSNKTLPLVLTKQSMAIEKFNKIFKNYLSAARAEPVAYLFYGPPGAGKSTLMKYLIQELGSSNSIYTHASQSKDKEFYDLYENEDIFVMDDIGQKGLYQWSDMINIISCIKYPLPCAEVDKKGTKFFSSSFILLTSNTNPKNLVLTAECGITNKEALCRRIKIMDFSRITFENGKYSGVLETKHWNLRDRDYEIVDSIDLDAVDENSRVDSLLSHVILCLNRESKKVDENAIGYKVKGTFDELHIPKFCANGLEDEKSCETGNLDDFTIRSHYKKINIQKLFTKEKPKTEVAFNKYMNEDGICTIIKDGFQPITYSDFVPNEKVEALAAEAFINGEMLKEDLDEIVKNCFSQPKKNVQETNPFLYSFCCLGEFLGRVFTLRFENLKDFINHFTTLVTQPAMKIVGAVATVFSSILFIPWYYFTYKRKTTWNDEPQADLVYVNRKVNKHLYRPNCVPESIITSIRDTMKTDNIVSDPLLSTISKATKFIRYNYKNRYTGLDSEGFGLCYVSGKLIVVPHHFISLRDPRFPYYVTIIQDETSVVVDNAVATPILEMAVEDLCVLKLNIAYQFPLVGRFIENLAIKGSYYINLPNVTIDSKEPIADIGFKSSYMLMDNIYKIFETDKMTSFSFEGLCGAIYSTANGVIGMHVAGSEDNKIGICRVFPARLLKFLRDYDNEQRNLKIPTITSGENGVSKALVNETGFVTCPDKTIYCPSTVDGIFEKTRQPANLNAFGKRTVFEMSKKSHIPTKNVNSKALEFATTYVKTLLAPFSKCDEAQMVNGKVVKGVRVLNEINKTTSCGAGFPLEKEDYIDYENSCLKPNFKPIVDKLRDDLTRGEFDFSSVMHGEILKDELRNIEKVNKPRAFKMAPLPITCLQRQYLSELLIHLHTNRKTNGVQVGINPYSDEWGQLIKKHIKHGNNVFDGDWGKWDGGMLPQFQAALASEIIKAFKGNDKDKEVLRNLLLLIQNCPTVTVSSTYFTTHSLPSGIALTAEYNSLVNKMMAAYIFYVLFLKQFNKEPSITQYITHVIDDVYGDDKLVGVSDDYKTWFNGKTFCVEAQKLGLDFTPADKGEWTYETRSVFECQFLKRSFKFHSELKKFVAPLELNSLTASLNYVKDITRRNFITQEKLLNFQREVFLHDNEIYDQYMNHVMEFLEEHDLTFTFLPHSELVNLYNRNSLFDGIKMA